MEIRQLVLVVLLFPSSAIVAWTTCRTSQTTDFLRRIQGNSREAFYLPSRRTANDDVHDDSCISTSTPHHLWTRRSLASTLSSIAVFSSLLSAPLPSNALVKGNAPPSKTSRSADKRKCTNVEECQTLAEQQADRERLEELTTAVPTQVTPGGTRYRDMELATDSDATLVKANMQVALQYKVLKLGKRSYDGLSGEGTVVFSRGYGLEDDEQGKDASKTFVTTVGARSNIEALNEALVGMRVGGTRRFAVLPQKGWRKPGNMCDGGPGGRGQGGDLKTDYVVVPTATMVAEEACFDQTKQPFPSAYAEQRRMAQRFDQSLIMEVKVVAATSAEGGL
jgi:FKBP-type peptidyl-prolyl cis-trans isomerase